MFSQSSFSDAQRSVKKLIKFPADILKVQNISTVNPKTRFPFIYFLNFILFYGQILKSKQLGFLAG